MFSKTIQSSGGRLPRNIFLFALLALFISACGSVKKSEPSSRGGGYYKNDGPPVTLPKTDLTKIPDAVPKAEPLHKAANRPYKINGRAYTPRTEVALFRERGVASWYGKAFHGNPTSSGEIYDMYAMTAAHPTLPIPSYIRVTNIANGRSIVVRVNDRGPFLGGRIVDLSYAAAVKLGYIDVGKADVLVEQIVPGAETVNVVSNTGAASGHYYLQLGAFTTQSNASSFMSGILSVVSRLARQIDIVDEGKMFRVFAGPFASQLEARAALDVLGRTTQINGFVVQR